MSKLIAKNFRHIAKLSRPLRIGSKWVDRGIYEIKLQHINKTGLKQFGVYNLAYNIILKLSTIPFEFLLKFLHNIFREIFFIIKHNTLTPDNPDEIRFVLHLDDLNKAINLNKVTLDSKGVKQLLHDIERNIQSNEQFFINSLIKLQCVCYKKNASN